MTFFMASTGCVLHHHHDCAHGRCRGRLLSPMERKPKKRWSGRPGSNRRPTAWKAETLPLSYSRWSLFSTAYDVSCCTVCVQMDRNGGSLHKVCTKPTRDCPNAQNPFWCFVTHCRVCRFHSSQPTPLNL